MWVMPITPDINTEERLLQFRRQYKGHLTYEDGWRIVSRLRKIRARPPTTPAPAQQPEEDISSDVSLSSTSSD
jgi:hypothetical protein